MATKRLPPLPASNTKSEKELVYELWPQEETVIIEQDNEVANSSTGRTLWLGGQVLSVYLFDALRGEKVYKTVNGVKRRKRCIDLGAGTGLLSLSLRSMGYDVVSTDVDFITHGLLRSNLERNTSKALNAPLLQARTLDWTIPPDRFDWMSENIASPLDPTDHSMRLSPVSQALLLKPPFDLIVTSDSIYSPFLSQPLLRTLHALSSLSPRNNYPPIYVSLEVRDPALIADFLESARKDWGFKTSQVDEGRLEKLVGEGKMGMGWAKGDWEGVEVWKMKWSGVGATSLS